MAQERKAIRVLLLRSFKRRRHADVRSHRLRRYHAGRAPEAGGVLRPRIAGARQILCAPEPGHAISRRRKRTHTGGSFHPTLAKPHRPAAVTAPYLGGIIPRWRTSDAAAARISSN